ncbi:MAG TPA: hypothetical protein HPP83_03410 [Candidatus Hydrogenedentes bacterium]|nr:hypothetical protein [Candidatus Hydrogenedentota bacterium]
MITIQPTETRYVRITHANWNCHWNFQFPESIAFADGWAMDYQPIYPNWQRLGPESWCYEWRTEEAYVREQERYTRHEPTERRARKAFIVGLSVRAQLDVSDERSVALTLILTNESSRPFERVVCDGGCLQAKTEAFAGRDEVSRTYIMVGGAMVSMATLDRTVPMRCMYVCDPVEYERPPLDEGEWFWGRSSAAPDSPVVVGMESVDGARAVALVYTDATSGSANADEHHCIHSRPCFGDIPPGASITRRGLLVFGSSVQVVVPSRSENARQDERMVMPQLRVLATHSLRRLIE